MTRTCRHLSSWIARGGRRKVRPSPPRGRAHPSAERALRRGAERRSAGRRRRGHRGTAPEPHASPAFSASPARHRPSPPSPRIVLSYPHARAHHRRPDHPVAAGLLRPSPRSEHSAIGQPDPCPADHRGRSPHPSAPLMRNAPPGGAPYYRVPYGQEELEFMVQPWFDLDVVESGTATPITDLPAAVQAALAAPLRPGGAARWLKRVMVLAEMADDVAAIANGRGREARAGIAVTDLTRASPDAGLVPALLDELNVGVPDERITVVVGVGLHRATTDA